MIDPQKTVKQRHETILNYDKANNSLKKTPVTQKNFVGVKVELTTDNENDECSICLEPLNQKGPAKGTGVCQHLFHDSCLKDCVKTSSKCPVCRETIVEKLGPCPNGDMYVTVIKNESCRGHEDCRTISIVYTLLGGRQGPQH